MVGSEANSEAIWILVKWGGPRTREENVKKGKRYQKVNCNLRKHKVGKVIKWKNTVIIILRYVGMYFQFIQRTNKVLNRTRFSFQITNTRGRKSRNIMES
jgi:hypothetical protein